MNHSTRRIVILLAVCIIFVTTVHSDTCYYTGTCYNQERYTTSCGFFGWSRCSRYRTVSSSCNQSSTCAYTLSSCGSCSDPCNPGWQTCTYQCRSLYCSLPDKQQNQACFPHCIIDGGWSTWNSWKYNNSCSVTCGGGTQFQTRTRNCTNPNPRNGGKQCIGSSIDSQVVQCNMQSCPVDGGWSEWSHWSCGACSVTCCNGTKSCTRSRTCTNPRPQYGGADCSGELDEERSDDCFNDFCQVPCDGSQYFFPNMCPSSCPNHVYFQCTSNTGVAIKKECNATLGLFWSPQQLTCNYRSSVHCAEEEDSPKCEDGEKIGNTEDCGKYLICVTGIWQEMTCSIGTMFNLISQTCDWPENVRNCSNASITTTRTTAASSGGRFVCNSLNCTCDQIMHGYTEHPTDCTKFIHCVWNKPFIFACANGTYWDQSQLICRYGMC